MIRYEEISKNARKFLALTGYTVEEFQALRSYFQTAFANWVTISTLAGKPRRGHPYSPYKHCPLPPMAAKLRFILVYVKHHLANVWIHRLHPGLNQALADARELPVREVEQVEFDEESQTLFFHDGTERPILRPKDPDVQKQFYSGKKKHHTVKNNVIIDALCKIRFLTKTWEGRRHDKRIADAEPYRVPKGSTLYQDTGFQGFRLEGVTIIQPKKKPRGKDLTSEEQAENRRISSIRIRIEHAIGGVKRYRIVKDTIRNWKKGFRDKIMETCCGLHNFRLNFRPWNYETP